MSDRYFFGPLQCIFLEQRQFAWVSPPPIARQPTAYEDFFEERGDGGNPVMNKVVTSTELHGFRLYNDQENGRRFHFLNNVEPHVGVLEVGDFGLPVPLMELVDESGTRITSPRSRWMYLHDEPRHGTMGGTMEVSSDASGQVSGCQFASKH
jgi:hypothetical protein